MADQLLDTLRRWFEIIEVRLIDADSFSAYEVWVYAQSIVGLAQKGQDLHPAAINMLSEIGERLDLPTGASATLLGHALERHFGQCPYGQETLDQLTAYLGSQLNAFSAAAPSKGPSLSGDSKQTSEAHKWPTKDLGWGSD